ncbi:rhomboid family intramembrane serine protease [Bacillus sp. Bva_UNVM-123]|uniref:rhomboid family intramembrane serine protease n=1 Tax=Bacillus sp. Bva_UNVM-123 TaxID=2829798 RepID=UPI00391F3C18
MSFQEEYVFWRLAQYLISAHEYRIVQLSQEQNELWLEKIENKEAQVIRLLRYNLDWSNWMQNDIERTAINGENIRKQAARGNMNVINIYVSAYPPVDDYECKIAEPFSYQNNEKTKVKSIIFDKAHYAEAFQQLGSILNHEFSFPVNEPITESEIDKVKLAALSEASNRAKKEQKLFNHGKPFFTYMFIIIQVVMFLLLELQGGSTSNSTLIKYGAKFNPLILDGEWWRFFTPMFLHIGVLHLLMNTLALYYLGTAVERIYGKGRFFIIYILAGFSGSLASFIFSTSISAGASGAIFGCFGALLYFGTIYPRLFFRTIGVNILVVLGINLLFGFSMPGIDNAGHIGGLIGGFLATGIVHFPKQKKLFFQLLFLCITAISIIGLLQYGFHSPEKLVDENSMLVLAQDYIKSNEYEKVEVMLTEYVNKNSASADSYLLLGFVELQTDNLIKAKEHLVIATEKRSNFHEAYFYLAYVYLKEGKIDEANKYAKMADELMPNQKDYENLLQMIKEYEAK